MKRGVIVTKERFCKCGCGRLIRKDKETYEGLTLRLYAPDCPHRCGKGLPKIARRLLVGSRHIWNCKGHKYWLLKIADPNIWVLEHRHIIEIKLGRKLLRKESIHHINGDGLDNRIENLLLMPLKEHQSMHKSIY